MQRVVFCLLATCALVAAKGVKLNKDAQELVDAANGTFTPARGIKLIKIIASQNDNALQFVKSLAPITPAAYNCFFTNGNKLGKQVKAGQINETEVSVKLLQACGSYASQLTQLQTVANNVIAPIAATIKSLYTQLPQSAKDTLTLAQQLKCKPGEEPNQAEKAAVLRQITASIRQYSDADRNQIALVLPSTAQYLLPNGTKYAEFNEHLDLVDKKADGTITEEEKESMAAQSLAYNQQARANAIPNLEKVADKIDNYVIPDSVSNDADVTKAANVVGSSLVKLFRTELKSAEFKKKLNQAIKKSNQMQASS